jgi:hypothetical protein
MKDNGNGLRQVEFPVAGMRGRRIVALDAACSALLVAKEAKATAAAAEKRAKLDIARELLARELDQYLFVDGERRFVAHGVSKDDIALVELKPKATKKPAADQAHEAGDG